MAQLKMDPPAAGAAAAPSPREVIIAALSKGLDGGMSGAAAMTIQVGTSVSRNTVPICHWKKRRCLAEFRTVLPVLEFWRIF